MFGILKSFKLSECRDSYKEFLTLILHVYLYNNTNVKTKKRNIKAQYKILSKKLNYPYFSDGFLLNYFN